MLRATLWLLIPCFAVAPAAAQGEEPPVAAEAAGKKPLVQKLLEADDASRPAALVAVIEDQIATNAVYAGQYAALAEVREQVVPLVSQWIVESPKGAKDDDAFRRACISVLRDIVEEPSDELKSTLEQIAKDDFENKELRAAAMYALAQFGDRSLVGAKIESAMKQTTLPEIPQQFQGWQALCDIYYNLRDYESAVKSYRQVMRIIEGMPGMPRGIESTYYNFACSLALAGETEEALGMLEKGLEAGKQNGQQLSKRMIDTDMDIASLRGEARFAELVAKYFGDGGKDDR